MRDLAQRTATRVRTGRTARRFATDTRGQTLQDYVMGISIFLITIAIVFSFLPALLAPFTAPIDDSVTARADRSVATLTYSLSSSVHPNVLNVTETQEFFASRSSSDQLREYLGLSATTRVNVTVRHLDTEQIATVDGTRLTGGQIRSDGPVAAASRIVVVDSETYKLTVQLW